MADLTTLENVKGWLGLTKDSDDAILSRLITAVSTLIEEELNRAFAAQSYTDIVSGDGSARLLLKNYPVIEVASVFVGGVEVPPAPSPIDAGWLLEESALYLTGYAFTRGCRNVVVSYQAGFETIPFDVEQAAIALVSRKYRERDRIGQASKSVAGDTVSYLVNDMKGEIQTILANYLKPAGL